jgi:hypothetical protein
MVPVWSWVTAWKSVCPPHQQGVTYTCVNKFGLRSLRSPEHHNKYVFQFNETLIRLQHKFWLVIINNEKVFLMFRCTTVAVPLRSSLMWTYVLLWWPLYQPIFLSVKSARCQTHTIFCERGLCLTAIVGFILLFSLPLPIVHSVVNI